METTYCRHCEKPLDYDEIIDFDETIKILLDSIGVGFNAFCNCQGTIAEITEIARKKKEAAIKKLLESSGVPPRYIYKGFNAFEVTKENELAFNIAQKYSEKFDPKSTVKGLLLIGTPGTGKTHLATAIVIELINNKQINALFGSVIELLGNVKDSYSTPKNNTSLMQYYKTVKLLVLDDFGKEKTTDWIEEKLFEIIDYRYVSNLPTIITTNFTLRDIEYNFPRVGATISSRFHEMFVPIKMNGRDFRKPNA